MGRRKLKNNSWMMIICFLGILLLLIMAPAWGLNKENLFWIFIPVMVLFYFIMMRQGGGCCGGHRGQNKSYADKKEDQKKPECH
jgi:amino acid transporter